MKQKEVSLQNCFRLATLLHGNTVNYKKPWCNVKKCRKGERKLTDQLGAVDIYVLKGTVTESVRSYVFTRVWGGGGGRGITLSFPGGGGTPCPFWGGKARGYPLSCLGVGVPCRGTLVLSGDRGTLVLSGD